MPGASSERATTQHASLAAAPGPGSSRVVEAAAGSGTGAVPRFNSTPRPSSAPLARQPFSFNATAAGASSSTNTSISAARASGGVQLATGACELRGDIAGLKSSLQGRHRALHRLRQQQLASLKTIEALQLALVGGAPAAAAAAATDGQPATAGPSGRLTNALPGRRPASAGRAGSSRSGGNADAGGSGASASANRAGASNSASSGGDSSSGSEGEARQMPRRVPRPEAVAAALAAEERRTPRMFDRLRATQEARGRLVQRIINGAAGAAGAGVTHAPGAAPLGGFNAFRAAGGAGVFEEEPDPEVLERMGAQTLAACTLIATNRVEETCCICLSDMQPGELVRLLACGHRMHGPCLRRWLRGKDECVCPMCRHVSVRRESDLSDLLGPSTALS